MLLRRFDESVDRGQGDLEGSIPGDLALGVSKRAGEGDTNLALAWARKPGFPLVFSSLNIPHSCCNHFCFSSGFIKRIERTSAPAISLVGQGNETAIWRSVS